VGIDLPDHSFGNLTIRENVEQFVKLFAICSVFAFGLAACGQDPPAPSEVAAEGSWQLDSGTLRDEPVPLVTGHRITLTIEGDSATGRAACNRYGGTIRIDGDSLSLGETGATGMLCQPAVMSSEQAYFSALRLVETVKRDGAELVLSGGETALRFSLLSPVPEAELLGAAWLLESMIDGDTSAPAEGEQATLELRADRTLSGSTGCRQLTGTYVVEGDEILATELAAEGRCPTDLAEQDAHIVAVLGDGFTVAIEGDHLTLMSLGNLGLVYRSS
jgi:heat shock protein HslJ